MTNPYRALLDFACCCYQCALRKCGFTVVSHAAKLKDWAQRCGEKQTELKALVHDALRHADKTDFDVCEVEKRVRALETPLAALLPWSWDVPAPTEKEGGSEAGAECVISAGSEYLDSFCGQVRTAGLPHDWWTPS